MRRNETTLAAALADHVKIEVLSDLRERCG
jgi:hypothetical protein